MIRRLTVFLVAAALAAGPEILTAQEAPVRQITVQGEGAVDRAPDMAVITLGVEERAETASEAMAAASSVTRALIETLDAAGIAERDRQTSRLDLRLVYNRASSGSYTDKVVGFVASNELTVRARDLIGLGTLLDQIFDAGANRFRGLRFDIDDPSEAMDAARRAAMADALARAELFATAAGVALGDVITINEHGGSRPVAAPMAEMRMASDAVPIAAGEVTLRAQVSLVIELVDAAE